MWAAGEPAEKKDYAYHGSSSWTWQLPPGKCLKYDGDKCIEQEKREKILFFTAKGNLYLTGSGCQTFNDDYIYLALLWFQTTPNLTQPDHLVTPVLGFQREQTDAKMERRLSSELIDGSPHE